MQEVGCVVVVGLSRLIVALTSSGGQNFLDNGHPVRSAVTGVSWLLPAFGPLNAATPLQIE